MLKYKKNLTLSQGGLDIGLKVGILAEIGYMLQECAVVVWSKVPSCFKWLVTVALSSLYLSFRLTTIPGSGGLRDMMLL